ncbi:MAG: hypothetical protein QM740_14270 [Acidovorax sp.]
MPIFASPRFLSRVMAVDAASCAGTGALQLALADPMAALTGLPAPLLLGTGAFLVAYALAAAWMALRNPVPRRLVGLVVLGNFGWALACGALAWGGALPLTALGYAWLLVQAVVVVALAELQWMGLRATRGQVSAPCMAA